MKFKALDAHCHLHEYSNDRIAQLKNLGIAVIAVSDDYPSSLRTLELSKTFDFVIPALGLHPWEVEPSTIEDAKRIIEEIRSNRDRVRIVGEVGLDAKFKPHTLMFQEKVFYEFLDVARELRLCMNLHSVNTWNRVLELVYRNDIPCAVFHWYTGPLDLLQKIRDCGYFISINPAIKIQEKHRRVVEVAPLDMVLLESDAPYRYRGMVLEPQMIFETLEIIARVKGLKREEVLEQIIKNSKRFLESCNIIL